MASKTGLMFPSSCACFKIRPLLVLGNQPDGGALPVPAELGGEPCVAEESDAALAEEGSRTQRTVQGAQIGSHGSRSAAVG